MRKIVFIFSMSVLLSAQLLAQSDFSRFDAYCNYSAGVANPSAEISVNSRLSNHLKLTYSAGYFQDFKNVVYQASAGLAYSPKNWVTVGLRGGAKKGLNWPFISSQLWLGNNKTSMFVSLESAIKIDKYYMYKLSLSHNFSKDLNLGITAWRFRGVGPMIRYGFDNFNYSIFLFPAYDLDDRMVKVSLGLSVDISTEAFKRPLK